MIKLLAAVALAALVFAGSASAQQRSYGPAPSPNHYRCTADGKPDAPGTGWCKKEGGGPSSVGIPQASVVQATSAPASVRPLSPSELNDLKGVVQREAAPAPRAPVVVASATPTSVGGCWTKHEVRKDLLVQLLNIDTDKAMWNSVMCMAPDEFSKTYAWVISYSGPSSVTAMAESIKLFTEQDCTATLAKHMVIVSPTGQPSAFKCVEGDVLWVDPSGIPVWTAKGGKPLKKADVILAKKE